MKPIFQRLPELFFIGLGVYWATENFFASEHVNWIALFFILILVFQVFVQHRVVGVLLGLVLGLICAYMMFAVLSEFRGFKSVNDKALQLLAFGIGIFGTGVVLATAMVYKFITLLQNPVKQDRPLTA